VLLLAQATSAQGDSDAARQLLEARRLVEVGTAELAARRRKSQDLTAMQEALERMEAAVDEDVERFVQADLDFHRALMLAAGNRFVGALYAPIANLLAAGRRETSRVETARRHALAAHRRILAAVRARKPSLARRVMESHLKETARDLEWTRAMIAGQTGEKP
jgi:DNA-binding FadR family transcriptional regulator